MRIDGSTLVKEDQDTFTLITQGESELVLKARDAEGENSDWVGDIRHHSEDFSAWHQAATSQMEILSPSKKVVATL